MLYENVVRLASEKGVSIANLEREAVAGNGTIGKWKTQGADGVRYATLAKIAAALGVSVSALLEDYDAVPKA